MRLAVGAGQREVLLVELDGFLALTAALYRQIGQAWDPATAPGPTPEAELVRRARQQLAGEGPWQLEGSASELELLLSRLRAAAELALQRGTEPSPDRRAAAMNRSDLTGTDAHLDILSVTDALLAQVRGERSE